MCIREIAEQKAHKAEMTIYRPFNFYVWSSLTEDFQSFFLFTKDLYYYFF